MESLAAAVARGDLSRAFDRLFLCRQRDRADADGPSPRIGADLRCGPGRRWRREPADSHVALPRDARAGVEVSGGSWIRSRRHRRSRASLAASRLARDQCARVTRGGLHSRQLVQARARTLQEPEPGPARERRAHRHRDVEPSRPGDRAGEHPRAAAPRPGIEPDRNRRATAATRTLHRWRPHGRDHRGERLRAAPRFHRRDHERTRLSRREPAIGPRPGCGRGSRDPARTTPGRSAHRCPRTQSPSRPIAVRAVSRLHGSSRGAAGHCAARRRCARISRGARGPLRSHPDVARRLARRRTRRTE